MFALHLQWPRGGAREKKHNEEVGFDGSQYRGHFLWSPILRGGSNNANVG